MNTIKIPAEELLCFGGIEYCLAKKNLSTLQDCDVTLTGKPGALEMLLLGNYLFRNKITLSRLNISGGKELFNINGYKIISEKVFSENRISAKDKRILDRINSEKNKELWASMINTYSFFSIKGPEFWKLKYDTFMSYLLKSNPGATDDSCEVLTVKKLQLLFQKNCDTEKSNFFSVSHKELPMEFIEQSQKLKDALKTITKDKRAKLPVNGNCTVLFYSTKLFHPDSEKLFFIQAENGIELLAPDLNLYLFFPDYETKFIVPFFEYLKNNFINLTKEYAVFIKGNTLLDMIKEKENEEKTENITFNSRNRILETLKQTSSKAQIIQNYIKELIQLASSYGLELKCAKKFEELTFVINKKDDSNGNQTYNFNIPAGTLLVNYENTKEMVEKEFKRIALGCR